MVDLTHKAAWYDEHLGSWNVQKRVLDYKAHHQIGWGNKISADEFIARVLLEEGTGMQINSNDALIDNNNGSFGKQASRALVNTGQWFKSWTSTPLKREATMQTLPIMQAFFYFFLIIITPFVLALSGYSLKAVGSMSSLFFMAIFIQYLWHLGSFLERATISSLGENNVVSAIQNIMVAFYYVAPILLSILSSLFGGIGGALIAGIISPSQGQTNEGANTARNIAKSGVTIASKGAL